MNTHNTGTDFKKFVNDVLAAFDEDEYALDVIRDITFAAADRLGMTREATPEQHEAFEVNRLTGNAKLRPITTDTYERRLRRIAAQRGYPSWCLTLEEIEALLKPGASRIA